MAKPSLSLRGFFLYLLYLLCLPPAMRAQQPLVDAADISRELLYHAARRIETSGQQVIFRAGQFTYRFKPSSSLWEVGREKNDFPAEAGRAAKSYTSARSGVEYLLKGTSSDDEGILEIRRADQSEPVAHLRLWERQQLATPWLVFLRQDTPSLTAEALAKDLEVSDPEVAGVADDGAYLWLAIRYSTAEGSLGIGTVVRFDPRTSEAKAFQPPELALSSVTHIVAAGGALWLGAARFGEGAVFPTKGLVRFDPGTGEVRSYLPGSSALVGSIVTALATLGDALWVATDAGMCRSERPGSAGETWTCWHTVPTVRLTESVPVSNRPGAPPGGRLPAGSYEVRWANVGYFEVITSDWIEGWLAADDFREYARLHFEAEPYELANSGGGPAPMRLLAKPGGDPLAGAIVYRIPLEPVGAATNEGWQRVRARAGWISRKGLEVAPVVQPAREPASR